MLDHSNVRGLRDRRHPASSIQQPVQMPKFKSAAIIIFMKNAEKGKVKSRLASTLGEDKALQIYKALLQHTRDTVLKIPVERLLYYSQDINLNDDWLEAEFHKYLQQGKSLGDRMTHAFKKAFMAFQNVVIVGSDCPQLSKKILTEAFDQLRHHPFVIGPAKDGGYYLLGMRQFSPEVFQNITWSTDTVFTATTKAIEKLGHTYHVLPTLSDVDYEEDWKAYGWEV